MQKDSTSSNTSLMSFSESKSMRRTRTLELWKKQDNQDDGNCGKSPVIG